MGKSECRNPKHETNPKSEFGKGKKAQLSEFRNFYLSNLFRISGFGFRNYFS